MDPHSSGYQFVIAVFLAETLILALAAGLVIHLRNELGKSRKAHSAIMAIIRAIANVPKFPSARKRQVDATGANLSIGPDCVCEPNKSAGVGAVCPLEAEGLPRGLCPLLDVTIERE